MNLNKEGQPVHDPWVYQKTVYAVGTPTFIYDETDLRENVRRIQSAARAVGFRHPLAIHPMYFTNPNPVLHDIVQTEGAGVGLQSVTEWHQLKEFGYTGDMIVSPSALKDEDLAFFLDQGLLVYVSFADSLRQVAQRQSPIGIRIDMTPEEKLRHGFKWDELSAVREICEETGQPVYAVHAYPGSGHNLPELLTHAQETVALVKTYFPDVAEINVGGGYGFDYHAETAEKKHFPWTIYLRELHAILDAANISPQTRIVLEASRDVFASAGQYVMQVYSRQSRRSHRYDEVFVDSSANAIPSPRHTGRQHEIAVLGADFTPLPMAGYVYVRMSGETTMTKDFLNTDRPIAVPPAIRKGDHIVMFDMGAYGRATRSEFMNKPPDAVVLFRRDGALDKIVERGGYLDSVRHVLRQPIRL